MVETGTIMDFIKVFQNSEVIFEENNIGNEMYIITSGEVRLFTTAPGYEVVLATLGPGEFFGEMSLVGDAPRAATAVAVEEDTRLVALDRDRFLYLVSQQPAFALSIMHEFCQRIRKRWFLCERLIAENIGKDDLPDWIAR